MSIVEGLIESLKAPSEPFFIDFGLGEDKRLYFTVPTTYAELRQFERDRDEWAAAHAKLKSPPSPDWAPWTQDEEVLKLLYSVVHLSSEPKIRWEQAFAMQKAPAMLRAIKNHLEFNQVQILHDALRQRFDEAKNDSTGTPTTDSASASVGESSGDTRTP